MKHTLTLAALFAATLAQAQTATVAPAPLVMDGTCDLIRGSTIVARNIANNPAAIAAAMQADTLARKVGSNYRCRAETTGSTTYGAAPPPPPPPPTGGTVVYLSDCQTGAVAGCVPGNNANAGTEAAPKRDLAGVNLNTLPAGASVLFKRGGAWNVSGVRLDNANVTGAAPLTLADYGTGALPILNTPSGNTFQFGAYGSTVVDGGYTFRNLKLDGRGTGTWGAFVQGATRDVIFDGVEIANFAIGIHSQQGPGAPNDRLTVRNSFIHHNSEHGMLGAGNGFVFENNRIEDNNPSGGGFEHGTYFSPGPLVGGGRIVGNTYRRNSAPGGVCTGGNMTLHGMWDGLLIENNVIEQASASPTCFGYSVTAGYSTAEFFRNTVIRGNTVVNVGACALCISAAPGVLVEGNKVFNTQANGQAAVLIPAIPPGPGDDTDSGAVIRNNVICATDPNSAAIRAPSAAATAPNTVQTGAAATTGACAR